MTLFCSRCHIIVLEPFCDLTSPCCKQPLLNAAGCDLRPEDFFSENMAALETKRLSSFNLQELASLVTKGKP